MHNAEKTHIWGFTESCFSPLRGVTVVILIGFRETEEEKKIVTSNQLN